MAAVKIAQQQTTIPARKRGKKVKQPRTYTQIVASLPSTLQGKIEYSRSAMSKSYALSKWLMVYGMSVLSRKEYMVLSFIFSRTLHYGKMAEMITKEQFLSGVWQKTKLLCSPVGGGPRELYKAIHSLEKKGFIVVHPIGLGRRHLPTLYEIAIDCILESRPVEENMSKLNVPRALKLAPVVDINEFREAKRSNSIGIKRNHGDDNLLVSFETTKYTKKIKDEIEEIVAVPSAGNATPVKLRGRRKPRPVTATAPEDVAIDCKTRIRHVIEAAGQRSTVKRMERAGRAGQGASVQLAELNATWKQAMIGHYGSCTAVGLTAKEFGMFKRIVKVHEPSCSWRVFFTWAITNWASINRESRNIGEFKKKQSKDWSLGDRDRVFLGTEAPDLSMVVRHFVKLLKRYSQEEMSSKTISAPEREDVAALRKELGESRHREKIARDLLKKSITAPSSGHSTSKVAPVTIIEPEGDKFFDGEDEDLPAWE